MPTVCFSQEASRQIESLQQQVQHIASQRDAAYMQVANIQEQCQQYAASLSNLQLVLEHFQKGTQLCGDQKNAQLKISAQWIFFFNQSFKDISKE